MAFGVQVKGFKFRVFPLPRFCGCGWIELQLHGNLNRSLCSATTLKHNVQICTNPILIQQLRVSTRIVMKTDALSCAVDCNMSLLTGMHYWSWKTLISSMLLS